MNDTLFNYASTAPPAAPSASWTGIIVVVCVLAVLLVGLIIVMRRLMGREEMHGMTRDEVQKRWMDIEKASESGVMGAKMAIVEADKLLDGTLKSMAMSGTTLGERLKFACYKYPELRKVWPAHITRNQLVHETTFEISMGRARQTIQEYKRALKVLKAL